MESTKEEIEKLLKGFDPMFNRSDDFTYWTRQKELKAEILQRIKSLHPDEQEQYLVKL